MTSPISRLRRFAAATAVLALAALALTGCNVGSDKQTQEANYAKASDMEHGDIAIQNWIPREATDVKILFSPKADRSPIAKFTVNPDTVSCSNPDYEEQSNLELEPQLEADWFKKMPIDTQASRCGSIFYFFQFENDRYTAYAWDARKPAFDNRLTL